MTTDRDPLLARGAITFMNAPSVACDTEALRDHGAKAAFLGVPFDQATVYRSGSSAAPRTMRFVSDQYLSYLGDFDVDVFEEFRLVDVGDVPIIPANAERSRNATEDCVGRILDAGAMPICIGGDHSIPIPIGRAFAKRVAGKAGYIHFDAHIDCQPDIQGELFTNWSHMARMVELPNVDPRNVCVVGARGASNPPEQWEFARSNGIRVFRMREIELRGIEDVVTEALDLVTDGTEAFYVSFDSDVVDAGYLPGTDGPEPGGLTAREMLRACELVGARRPSVMDIVELIPAYDMPHLTSFKLACFFIFHVLGGMAKSGERIVS